MTTSDRLKLLLKEAGRAPTQPWRPRFSNAGDCRRKLVYEAVEEKEGRRPSFEDRPVRWNAAAAAGTGIGELIENAAIRLGAASQEWAMIPRTWPRALNPNLEVVTGSADIVWEDSVWDLKLAGDYAFRQAKIEPDPKHLIQVQGYAAALCKPRWALIYIALAALGKGEELPIVVHEGETPPDAAERVAAVWRDVEGHVGAGTLPDRDFPQHKCKAIKCRFLEGCWS